MFKQRGVLVRTHQFFDLHNFFRWNFNDFLYNAIHLYFNYFLYNPIHRYLCGVRVSFATDSLQNVFA